MTRHISAIMETVMTDINANYAKRLHQRRVKILETIEDTMRWPVDASQEEKRELIRGGFVHDDGLSGPSIDMVSLTSLGELEIGYDQTDSISDAARSLLP